MKIVDEVLVQNATRMSVRVRYIMEHEVIHVTAMGWMDTIVIMHLECYSTSPKDEGWREEILDAVQNALALLYEWRDDMHPELRNKIDICLETAGDCRGAVEFLVDILRGININPPDDYQQQLGPVN